MKTKMLTLAAICALALAACGGAATPAPAEELSFAAATAAPAAAEAPALGGGEATTVERLVIKNASLSIVVDDPTATVRNITSLAEGTGGFVVSTNTYQTTFGPDATAVQRANIAIRVPSAQFNSVLDQIRAMAVEVENENISGQDVTADYVDLQSRLKNLEAAEAQLQSIMEEATKTEDVLNVYNQLVYTREQIEVIKGQMKYYQEAAALSSISIELIPNVATQPIEIGGWHPEGTAKQAIEILVRIVQSLVDLAITFGIICGPFAFVLGLPALFGWRWWWSRRQKAKAVEAQQK
jgi:predicted negative regulator of RcsB-dependent stress response